MPIRTAILHLCVASLGLLPAFQAGAQIYKNPKAPLEDRVKDLFEQLEPGEKMLLLTGTEKKDDPNSGFSTHAIPRLGIPEMSMVDAGQGVRGGMKSTQGPATAFPSGIAMGSTWDTDLLKRIGEAIGNETLNKGTGSQVLLGPAVNIHRSPLNGRNGEYFSEDPYLAARLGVSFIAGVQGAGAVACIKHFAANNQEVDRDFVDVKVGERALREIYLPAFEAGVKEGKVWAVMSSYNKVNGRHASANPYLLLDVLKKGWGFDGMVMSDWGGVHETAVVQAGNDLEMPGNKHVVPEKLEAALQDGTVTQAAIDDSAQRVIRTILRAGLLDDAPRKLDPSVVNSAAHKALAYEAASKGIVLLKNEGKLLPLDRKTLKSIAVIGETAKSLQIGALGSPEVQPLETTQILDSIQKLAGKGIKVNFAAARIAGDVLPESAVAVPGKKSSPGFRAEYFKNIDLHGEPALVRTEKAIQLATKGAPAPGIPATDYSIRWTATLTPPATGTYRIAFTGDDGFRVFVDDQAIIERWKPGAASTIISEIDLEQGKTYALRVEFFQAAGDAVARLNWQAPTKDPYADAVAAAKKAEVAIVAVSTLRTEGEGNDRPSMDLPFDQAALIRAVAAANPKTIVVINNGTPVTMKDWISDVPAALEAWLPGQEGAAAVAAIIFGDVNPSGRLTDTLAMNREDYPDFGNFPGAGDFSKRESTVKYDEGIYVGYRHFDKKDISPAFPFGHGLSYTTFDYSDLKLSQSGMPAGTSILVSVNVENTGDREGDDIVQLYVHDPKPKVDKPVRELKGFERVSLKPGETKTVTFTLTPRDFAYFDVPGKQWKADAGTYEIEIGASSRDIKLRTGIALDLVYTEKVPLSQEKREG